MLTRRDWLGSSAAVLAAACRKAPPLPVFATVPAFRLTSQSGQPFDSAALRGAPWLGSFFFTSCKGPCPRMNATIHGLQEQTYSFKNLHLVSFTTDPETDTPEVLTAYAKRYKADPERWIFLTGPRDVLNAIGRDGFQTGELDLERTHSTRIMLMDGQSRVRGHFQSDDPESLGKLTEGIAALYQEAS